MHTPTIPKYVDGILKLHAQLDEACKIAYDYSVKYFMNLDLIESAHEERTYRLFIDFSESQPLNSVKGYFVFNKTIHRFLSINLDYAVLFPVRNHSGLDDGEGKGIPMAKIREFQRNREKVIITLNRKKYTGINQPLYVVSVQTENDAFSLMENEIDDLGNPYYSFTDIECLRGVKLPETIKSTTFSLVGQNYYAPMSTNRECYCVLFAQKDNKYDPNAIKVLRWFPGKRTIADKNRRKMIQTKDQLTLLRNKSDQVIRGNKIRVLEQRKKRIQDLEEIINHLDNLNGHCFFELGHISRTENADLHRFMIDNDSRLLFGTLNSRKISLIGGIEIFYSNNDFDYPLSLSKIPIK